MGDLSSALNSAFAEAASESAGGSTTPAPAEPTTTTRETSEDTGAHNPETAGSTPAPAPNEPTEEPSSFHNPSREELELINKNPALKTAYESFRRGFLGKTQELAEERKRIQGQAQFWEALNNPQTQRQAVEALARSVGFPIQPTDQPQREQAAAVADGISEEWSKVVGPEAAQLLRPLIEKTALAAVKGTLQPIEQATEYLQMDARSRQAEAQVSEFRAQAKSKGWNLTPEVEAKMAQLGQDLHPARPIETVQDGIKHLERLYRLATADTAEADTEKRIYERMQKAAQSAEPARGVPSTGREKRTNITKDMDLNQSMDVALQEAAAELGWK